jgi:predicted nucleic acid-binding protein
VSYLIDTNVLSELRRKTPDERVVRWFAHRPAQSLYLSVLTLGELRKGIELLAPSARKLALLDWLEGEIPAYFSGRILPVDGQVADHWGRLLARAARPTPAVDGLLAACASRHGLTLVTRNVRDVRPLGVAVLDPWNVDAA